MIRPALFLDRDGTINEYGEYIYRKEDFKFKTGIPELIKKYNELGWLVIVITNQAGVARGYYTEDDVQALHDWADGELAKYGAHIDRWYYCPHHPTAGIGQYKRECNCRKPKTGLVERACRDFTIDLARSMFVGDKPSDIECGERMGIKSILVDKLFEAGLEHSAGHGPIGF